MFCKHCGKELLNAAVICPGCGCNTKSVTEPSTGIIVVTYAMAFIIPIIGIFMAIYIGVKGKATHGIAAGIISIIMWIIWTAVTMAANESQYGYTMMSMLL